MKKILLFPYHPDLEILIKYKHLLQEHSIAGIISYKEDESFVQRLNQRLGISNEEAHRNLYTCDAIVIVDNYRDFSQSKYYEIIDIAIERKIDIYITPLAEAQLELSKYQGNYKVLERLPSSGGNYEVVEKKIHDINVPIVGVLGQGKHCGKFESEILLTHRFSEQYKVSCVCTNALGVLFGFYTMPEFLYQNTGFDEKVLKINKFVHDLEGECQDIIILGIPEGTQPFRRHEFHHFAEYPLILSAAVNIDLAVLCTYYIKGLDLCTGLNYLRELCQQKIGVQIAGIIMSNTAYEMPNEEFEKIKFSFLEDWYIRKYAVDLPEIDIPVSMINDHNIVNTIADNCVKILQGNVRAL